jgi:hypothetical protein
MPVDWGAKTASERGPVLALPNNPDARNAIGTHSGSYAIYRSLAVAAGSLDPVHIPDLTDTAPVESIGPFPQWADTDKIVSMDPYGHLVSQEFGDLLD